MSEVYKLGKIEEYTLQSGDFDTLGSGAAMDYARIGIDAFSEIVTPTAGVVNGISNVEGFMAEIENGVLATGDYPYHQAWSIAILYLTFPTGTYADIAAVRTALTGTKVQYSLATPVITNLTAEGKASGILQSFENGTMYLENGYKEAHTATANDITLSTGLSEIISIKQLDSSGKVITVLTTDDYDAFTSGDTSVTGLPAATDTYLVEGLLTYNISGSLTAEIPTNTSAVIHSNAKGVNANAKSIMSLQDQLNLVIVGL